MKYPSINYIGNKEKIVNWIISLIPKDVHSILDVFAGGCSVSYAAKLAGLSVYTNDILKINYLIGKALVENDDVVLSREDIKLIFSGVPSSGGFMDEYCSEKYYYKEECQELDLYRSNIEKLDSDYKKALALILLRRAMIRKMPYSRFTIVWDKIKQLRDEDFSYLHYGRKRAYHNQTFKFHFEDNVDDYNLAVFPNGRVNKAFNLDVYDAINSIDADAIYLDPPYAGTMNDYFGFYGLLDAYIEGKAVRPFENNFMDKNTIINQFERLFSKLGKYKYWILSYNSKSKPRKEELVNLMKKYASEVVVYEMPYAYKVTGKEKKQTDLEYLFIAKSSQYEE